MNPKFLKDITNRTIADTGLDRQVIENVIQCFLLELSHELATNNTIELPYIGDISLRNKKIEPNAFLKNLKNRGGFFASNIISPRTKTPERNSGERDGDSNSGK